MPASGSVLRIARFDRYSVELSSGGLFRSGVRVPIQSQPFQVLRLLLEAEGEVVSREQLRDALWPHDTFVDFDLGVNTAVRKLRQALEDSAEHPRFIETLPKLGYRFMIPVEWRNGSDGKDAFSADKLIAPLAFEPAVSPATPPKRHWKPRAATALAAVVILLLSAVLVSNKDGYLVRTRVGTWVSRVFFGRAVPSASLVTERRLTANPEDVPVTSAVISPDGKYLAYTDTTGFYLRQVATGETHPVPLPRGFEPLAGSWFPDSIHMIVPWLEGPTRPASLWKISIAGGTPHKLADEGWFPSVSPSGDQIAFVAPQNATTQEIWLVQGDGDNRRRLVTADSMHWIGPIAWSPDGKRLAYVRSMGTEYTGESPARESQVEIYELADGRTSTILSRPGIGAIAWAHDGRLIYATYEPNHTDSNLWWFRPGIQTPAPATPTRLTNAPGHVSGISITSDGKQLAVIRDYLQADIFIADIGPGPAPLGASRRLTLDERDDFPYSWTPDSRAVLFVSNRDGISHIYKQGLDQTQAELLVGGKHDLILPRLSPDGLSILYEDQNDHRLMRVALSGGPPQLLLQADFPFNVACARLPSTLCIYGDDLRLFKFDPVKGTSENFSVAVEGPWNLSPDGKYVSSSMPQQTDVLHILSLTDGAKMEIRLPGSAGIAGADWAADGKSLWLTMYTTEKTWKLVNVDRKGIVRPFLETPMRKNGWTMEWEGGELGWAIPSPDGRHLAYWETNGRSNAWLLENF
jgi:Tol biopolymer transport system component/DNA-binding winged helix-turn-helix (wHTH) protein